MNIRQAKDYIKDSIAIYLKKDAFGDYRIPVVRQRPIFLLGAPGIGKTAIMEQIAQEMGIALVSYSMTHHTRQSALGLPFIRQREYGGQTYDVSEYTMSEILSSIYDVMEESGVTEGILFLDEINCVSETLAPSMLQFLQYKVFGRHKVPEGWVIVTAGNPPEYNKSVREFDVVTMDRLKVLEVEPDYAAWKLYAREQGVHAAILHFLEQNKEYFYHMETTTKGRSYVTARGWEDLSQVMLMYEEEGFVVDETLFSQYLQNELIVKEFGAYYDLYNKYRRDYRVESLLSGDISDRAVEQASHAPFDERLSLLGMLLGTVQNEMRDIVETSDFLKELMVPLKALKAAGSVLDTVPEVDKKDAADGTPDSRNRGGGRTAGHAFLGLMDKQISAREKILRNLEKANSLSQADRKKHKRMITFLTAVKKEMVAGEAAFGEPGGQPGNRDGAVPEFGYVKSRFDGMVNEMKEQVEKTSLRLHHLFTFADMAFEEGNEMLVLVTELTVDAASSRYISMFGCDDYQKYNRLLMVSKRQEDLRDEIEKLMV